MATKNIKTTQAFTLRNSETGELTSYAYGQIYVVESTFGTSLISDGLAVEYTGAVAIPTGTKTITTNGSHNVAEYETASVNVPNPSTGSVNVTENGTVNVKDYASAVVAVPAYVVTYDANGGTGSVDPVACANGSEVELDDGSGLTAPTDKEFVGWGLTSDATEAVESPLAVTADVTLYAIYDDVPADDADDNGGDS